MGTSSRLRLSHEELDGDEDLDVTWRALWDDENLYVLVDVIDDDIINFEQCNWLILSCQYLRINAERLILLQLVQVSELVSCEVSDKTALPGLYGGLEL